MRSCLRRDSWLAHLPHDAAVEPYYDWLVHVGSLTDRIRARCRAFRVELLRQDLARPDADELPVLGLRAGEVAWVREVALYCGEAPAVFAHTALPRGNIRGAWHLIAGLGNKPLGALLFSDPRVRRLPFRFLRLDARHPLYHRAAAVAAVRPAGFWARRSLFRRAGRAILVTEVFLPQILSLRDDPA